MSFTTQPYYFILKYWPIFFQAYQKETNFLNICFSQLFIYLCTLCPTSGLLCLAFQRLVGNRGIVEGPLVDKQCNFTTHYMVEGCFSSLIYFLISHLSVSVGICRSWYHYDTNRPTNSQKFGWTLF